MSDTPYASYSSLALHRICAQQYSYRYIRELLPIDRDSGARGLGTWWHLIRAADAIDRGLAAGSLKWAPSRLNGADGRQLPVLPNSMAGSTHRERAFELLREWWDHMPGDMQESWVEVAKEPVPQRLLYMDARWQERWANDLKNELPLAVELKWRRKLPAATGPDGEPIDSNTMMGGYVDEVYFDKRRGMVVVKDHKTTTWLEGQTTLDDMMDSQLQLYAFMANDIIKEWGHGPVRSLAYDRAATHKPTTPILTKSGKLSTTVTRFDLTTYLSWAAGEDGQGRPYEGLKKDGSGAGVYQLEESLIDKLSSPAWQTHWFDRSLTPLNKNLIRTHLRAAIDTALDIQRTKVRFERTGEASRNLTRSCRYCDFAELCRIEMVGGPNPDIDLDELGLKKRTEEDRR